MRFATFSEGNAAERVGVVVDKSIYPLAELGFGFAGMAELIAGYSGAVGEDIRRKIETAGRGKPLSEVVLEAPIPHPGHDILCIGQNYLEHALEAARYKGVDYVKPDYPMYFSKRVNRAVRPGGIIPAHSDITDRLDYEAELAVVIGKTCDHVKPEDVFDHIFGYTIVNDVSARDIQSNHVQFTFGKSLDGFAPMGPWIVTRDEFRVPPHLQVRTRVNGEIRQDANTREFIFDIPFVISQLSAGITLEPGDIFITGTPSGVGMGFSPARFLKRGDVVECEIEGIGVLRNTVDV